MLNLPSRLALEALQLAFQRVGRQRISQRHLQPLDARRLDDKIIAPARIADTTLSMPPWAVCTITGMVRSALRVRQHAHAVETGITRSRTMASMRAPRDQPEVAGGVAAVDDGRR